MAFTTTTGAGGTSLIGTSGVDTATVAGNSFPLFIGAQAANDVVAMSGTTANVRAELGKGADNFSVGALTTSTISGNLGNDIIVIDSAAASTVEGSTALINGNQGADSFTIGTNAAITIKSGARILGGADNDTFTLTDIVLSSGGVINGNKGDDTITIAAATFSQSTIYGGQGNDSMTTTGAVAVVYSGDDGEDFISGSTASDTIFGGAGNDTILADDGGIDAIRDSLIGGSGTDTFQNAGRTNAGTDYADYDAAGDVADIITDFDVSVDKIKVVGATVSFGGAVQSGTLATETAYYAISGTLESDGSFTQKTIASGGFDTLIGASGDAGTNDIDDASNLVILRGVLATSVTSGNLIPA